MKHKSYETALRLATKSGKRSKKVYELLLAAASEGDLRATYALGTWYLFGTRFTKKDTRLAMTMLLKAANGGIPDAAHDVAVSYERGVGVRKSRRLAFEYNVRAALLGDAQSFYEVGRMYYHGIGTRKDRTIAEIWLAKAQKLGVRE
jgi:TPR repeat protein